MAYSKYYEKELDINGIEDTLLDIYETIAERQGFTPDYDERGLVNLHEDTHLLDTILYHIEAFGKLIPGYKDVRHLFKDKSDDKLTTQKETVTVPTPLGDIVVTSKEDPEYPGVWVDLKGDNVRDTFEKGAANLVMIEYHPDKKLVQAVLYADCDNEEPTDTIEYHNTQKTRVMDLLDKKVNEVFQEMQKELHIYDEGISPMDKDILAQLKGNLAQHIQKVLETQGRI